MSLVSVMDDAVTCHVSVASVTCVSVTGVTAAM